MRVLIVGPRFHGYNTAVAKALRALGHEAVVHDYDRPAGTAARLRNKAVHDLPSRLVPAAWRGEASRAAVEALRAVRPDRVLVIRGDLLGEQWWEAVLGGPARVVTWFYDELARMDYSWERVDSLPAVVSYSPQDAQTLLRRGLRAMHLPNAFDSLLPFTPRRVEEVTFIGARYEERVRLLRAARGRGVPLRAYGRDWSAAPRDVLATRRLPVPGISAGPQLDRAAGYGVMAGSLASINTHSRQDGFTMRTFEVSGVGGLQLVDRRDVDCFYEPDEEVLVFDDADQLADHVRRAQRDPAWARAVRERGRERTLAEHTFVHRMRQLEEMWA